ncbi:MAG TPA: DUF2304 domain-containing protein [Planctomycetota bacterium]|nr:DUF2304 domain-containing protein [Planctomycetota bacterium]
MGMDFRVRIVIFLLSLAWLIFVLRLVKRRKIWERYAIFWVYTGLAILSGPLLIDAFDWIALKLGVDHPPSFFFLVAILGILLLLLQFTVEITSLMRGSRDVTQALAILEDRVRRLEEARAEDSMPVGERGSTKA